MPAAAPCSCTTSNRLEIAFDAFDPETEQVVFDVKALFEGSDLDVNSANTPPGCQSVPSVDEDCTPFFDRLGLGGEGAAQTVFRKEAR